MAIHNYKFTPIWMPKGTYDDNDKSIYTSDFDV